MRLSEGARGKKTAFLESASARPGGVASGASSGRGRGRGGSANTCKVDRMCLSLASLLERRQRYGRSRLR